MKEKLAALEETAAVEGEETHWWSYSSWLQDEIHDRSPILLYIFRCVRYRLTGNAFQTHFGRVDAHAVPAPHEVSATDLNWRYKAHTNTCI